MKFKKELQNNEIEILIAEDSPTQAELLRYLLQRHRYKTRAVYDGITALASIKKKKPTIVISDILMPEIDGYQLCRRIKEDSNLKDIIVILLTILSDPRDILKGLECGADDFIIKPRHEKVLFSHIEQLLAKREDMEKGGRDTWILIAEDSPTQREALKNMLCKGGYKVKLAANGRDALEIAKKKKPGLIISDILMPDMDGFNLCRKLKHYRTLMDIPVILLSVLTKPEDIIKGYEAGADAYITKPYEEEAFLNKLKSIIETRRLPEVELDPLEIYYNGERYHIKANRQKLLNFMISIYDSAIQQNQELLNTHHDLLILNNQLKAKFNELQASEERFEALVKTIPDIVYKIDSEGRFLFLNESIKQLGYEPDELIGRHFSDIILPAQLESVSRNAVLPLYAGKKTGGKDAPKLFDERRSGKRMTIGLEVGLLLKDSSIRPAMLEPLGRRTVVVEINSAGLFEINPDTKERTFIGTVGMIRNITERKQYELLLRDFAKELERKVKERTAALEAEIETRKKAEQERETAKTQLFQSQKMEAIGRLAGGVAHDFNNILTVIQGYVELAMANVDESSPIRGHLDHVFAASKRASSLTSQLLLFSRKQLAQFSRINLNSVMSELLNMLKALIGEDIKIECDLQNDLWWIKGDRGNMEQVIMNLAINARDAMPEGGRLLIKIKNITLNRRKCKEIADAEPGRFVHISVSDTGIGMDEESIQHIFDPFFTTKDFSKGSGLGLSIVYGIVKDHHGCIKVDSEKGRGSTFNIYLPALSEDGKKERDMEEVRIEGIKGAGEMVLLVEDEKDVREFASGVLENYGYSVSAASTAEEALDIFEREKGRFKLLFSDVILPGRNGVALAEELISRKPDIKVLLTSGYTGEKLQLDIIRKRGFKFLQKPYLINNLLLSLRDAIEKE